MKKLDKRVAERRKTQDRRSVLQINVVDFKVDRSKLSTTTRNLIDSVFTQAKYLTNAMISSEDIYSFDTKLTEVNVVWKEEGETKTEIRSIENVLGQTRQSIRNQLISNLKMLETKKTKGAKEGELRFRNEVNSICFSRINDSWRFTSKKDQRKHSYRSIKLGKIGYIPVFGWHNKRLKHIIEWGPANLVRKPDGLHILCTGFSEPRKKTPPKGTSVGIDMGIKDDIVLSNGEKHNLSYKDETKRLAKYQQRISKKVKGSKNRSKAKRKFSKKQQTITNRKIDVTNKFVSQLQDRFETICIQDENLAGWQSSLFGKEMTRGVLGRIKSRLKKSSTTRVISKWLPTTKFCPKCGYTNHDNRLSDRTYVCDSCGFTMDRDIKSARVIQTLGLQDAFIVPTGRRDIKPVELLTSTLGLYSTLYAS